MSIVVAFIVVLMTSGEANYEVRVFGDMAECWASLPEARMVNRVLAVSECVKIEAAIVKPEIEQTDRPQPGGKGDAGP